MRRKSSSEKRLMGTYRPDRDRHRVQFASANSIEIKTPSFVRKNKVAFGEWKAVAPHLIAEGILKPTDISILASYCLLYARWRQAADRIDTEGSVIEVTSTTRTGMTIKPVVSPWLRVEVMTQASMMKTAVKLGLNPLDRSRVEVPEADDETGPDPFERFLDQGNDDPDLDYLELPRIKSS